MLSLIVVMLVPVHKFQFYLHTVTVEPQSGNLRVRECDDLVFTLSTSGRYTGSYQVTVQCIPVGGRGGKFTLLCPQNLVMPYL